MDPKDVFLKIGDKVALTIGFLAIVAVFFLRDTKVEERQSNIHACLQDILKGLEGPIAHFQSADKNKDKHLDEKELIDTPNVTKKTAPNILSEYDVNKDGLISMDEWLDKKLKRQPIPNYLEKIKAPWVLKYHPLYDPFVNEFGVIDLEKRYIFNTNNLDIVKELDKRNIPDELRNLFKKNGLPALQDASVEVEENGKKWIIHCKDTQQRFFVFKAKDIKVKDDLDIYERYKKDDFIKVFMSLVKDSKITKDTAPYLFEGTPKFCDNKDGVMPVEELNSKRTEDFLEWYSSMDTNKDKLLTWTEASKVLVPNEGKPVTSSDLIYTLPTFVFTRPPRPDELWINSPSNLQISVGLDKFDLSWAAPTPLSADKEGKNRKLVSIDGYEIIKTWVDKDTNKKQEKQIIISRKGDTTYSDTDLLPKIQYTYKLRAFTFEIKSQGGKEKIKLSVDGEEKDVIVSDFLDPASSVLPPQFKIILKGASEAQGVLRAHIVVQKYEKGEWLTSDLFFIKNGEIIGRKMMDRKVGREVDFSTDLKVIDIKNNVTKEKPETIQVPVVDKNAPNGIRYEPQVRQVKYTTVEVEYLDENGKRISIEREKQ